MQPYAEVELETRTDAFRSDRSRPGPVQMGVGKSKFRNQWPTLAHGLRQFFPATHPRLTSLFLTLSPMVCCIRQRRLLQCLKGSAFGQHFVVVHYCRQPAATCLLYFNSPPSIFFSCSRPEPYSLVQCCCCAAVTQRHLDSCSSTVR